MSVLELLVQVSVLLNALRESGSKASYGLYAMFLQREPNLILGSEYGDGIKFAVRLSKDSWGKGRTLSHVCNTTHAKYEIHSIERPLQDSFTA
jgi:hypothetical protein